MKNNRLLFLVCLLLTCTPARAQVTTWAQGFDKSVNAASARAYLGLGTNGGTGVSSFSADPLAGLFNVSVLTPTTTPHLQFSFQSQSANLVLASPDGAPGAPSFRALTLADLPPIPIGGSVTNFNIGDLSPLFTSSVGTPTSWPHVTFALTAQANNTFFAGPMTGGPLSPTFRSLVTGDLPDITSIVRGDVSSTAPISYSSGSGIFSMHVADTSHDGYLSAPDWNTFNGKGSGTVITITNSGIPNADNTLVSVSNAPALGIKSISAGANVSVTDIGGTNLIIAASSTPGGSSPTDLMQYQTNYLTTYRTVTSDAADGSTITGLNGFGDTLSIAFGGGTGTLTVKQNFAGPPPLGPWIEQKPPALANGFVTVGTQTFNPIAPYNNGGFYFQTYIFVRNTNSVRISAGFASAYTTVVNADNIITNYAIFRYSTLSNDSTWHGVLCNKTNQTFVDTGAALIPDTGYLLQIWKTNGSSNVAFVVNRTNTVTATSNAPNSLAGVGDLMGAYVGEDNLSSAAKTNWLHYIGYTVDWVVK